MEKRKETEGLQSAKGRATVVAKQLRYGDEVVQRIKNAKTVYEVDRVLISARRGEIR